VPALRWRVPPLREFKHRMQFAQLNLIAPLLRAVEAQGYVEPTPIQQQAIPYVLEGRDLLGAPRRHRQDRSFALPIIPTAREQSASGRPTTDPSADSHPTRELASQIGESFQTYGRGVGLSYYVIFGGVGQASQVAALRRGIDVLGLRPDGCSIWPRKESST